MAVYAVGTIGVAWIVGEAVSQAVRGHLSAFVEGLAGAVFAASVVAFVAGRLGLTPSDLLASLRRPS